MSDLRRTALGRAEAATALNLLDAWNPADRAAQSLHSGDVGWFLRFGEEEVRAALAVWSDSSGPVAVEMLDGPVLRVTVAPGFAFGSELAAAIAAANPKWIDMAVESPLRQPLLDQGWAVEDPWAHFVLPLSAPIAVEHPYVLVTWDDAEDRAAVQRASFNGSTYSVDHWRLMQESVAGPSCVDVLVRTPDGKPAAAATGWFAGKGRCALLEPVGADPEFRRRGYARAASLAAAEELRKLGASAVSVVTPLDNEAAVGLYKACGFEIVAFEKALAAPGRS